MKATIYILLCLFAVRTIAQNFAVQLARDTPNIEGLPLDWPIKEQPIGTSTKVPNGWRLLSKEQLEKLKSDNAAEKESWNAAQESAATQPKRDREAVIKQAIDDLKLIRDSSGTLTPAQLSNAVRALARALVAVIEEIRP